jgi:DNA-binding NarL/FixJ family response regulator
VLSRTILIVDDFEQFRHLVSSILQPRSDYRIISEVAEGHEAVREAAQLHPEVILLDIGLPGINGFEAARLVNEVSPSSKIIFLSIESDPVLVEEAFRTGAKGYVLKRDASELLIALDRVLEGKKYISCHVDLGASSSVAETAGLNGSAGRHTLTSRNGKKSSVHRMARYADDSSLVDGFARYIEASLREMSAVIVVASEAHHEGILRKLSADGVDYSRFVKDGTYIRLDATELASLLMLNGLPDPIRCKNVVGGLIAKATECAKGEYSKVKICGECAPTLLAAGNAQAAIELEHLWDEMMRNQPAETLCGYLSSAFPDTKGDLIFEKIRAEHSGVCSF